MRTKLILVDLEFAAWQSSWPSWALSLNIFRRHLKTHFLRNIDETYLAHFIRYINVHFTYMWVASVSWGSSETSFWTERILCFVRESNVGRGCVQGCRARWSWITTQTALPTTGSGTFPKTPITTRTSSTSKWSTPPEGFLLTFES